MAEAVSALAQRADLHLDALLSLVDDLPGLDDEWAGMDDGARAGMSAEWAHLMADVLTEIDEYSRGDLLSQRQQERFRDLKHKLKLLMPLIRKLNWYRPPVSLDDVA